MSILIKSILGTNITKSVIVPQSEKEHRRHSTAQILQIGQFGANQIHRMYKNYQAWSSISRKSIF